MADSALTRVARAMDIIPFVLENPGIGITDLASRFEVSEKQIIKDLDLIFLCGLPGYTPYELIDLTFDDGAVTIIDPQLFDKPRKFSETECVIILLGLSILKNSITDPSQIIAIDKLTKKLASKYNVADNAVVKEPTKPKYFAEILKAISNEDLLLIDYSSISDDQVLKRTIKPQRVIIKNGNYYLFAVDQELAADRIYRIDQIRSLKMADTVPLNQISANSEVENISFKLKISEQLLTEKYREIFTEISHLTDGYIVEGKISNLQWLHRWILRYSSVIEVIDPLSLRETIRNRAQAALDLYR